MANSTTSVKDIFATAREIQDVDERNRYLDEACAADTALRAEVEQLLAAIDRAGNFLGGSIHPPTIDQPVAERPGDTIGPYKLLQQLGEGGMGVVYMAEQTEPIERRVALKIIKPGMDSRQVIARFEAERQALAMMDHPNIARALDAGMTDTGRPFFVMELVKGVPITEYCDDHHLTPRERLELFVPICQAIQHAHQKGIIHRDIKPSNVLVADYDDHPVPKVIDFGVAKAIDHRLTEKTMFTEFGQVLGTFEYMSPEQAKLNQWDVDTRTDVYSLGVLLYELLSGEVPFDRQRLRSAAFDELLRIIREEEPPRPSTRLSTSQSLPTIAANRRLEPKKLSAVIHGELDWIVMKALDKDRTRRYETASKFAEDVEHYLSGDAVEACPPSAGYRLKKVTRRNWVAIVAGGAIAASLLVGASLATWQAIERGKERDRALVAERLAEEEAGRADREAERANLEAQKARSEAEIAKAVNRFLNQDLLGQANPYELPGQDVKLRDVLDLASQKIEGRFDELPLVEAAIHETLANTYRSVGEFNQYQHHCRLCVEIRRRVLGEGDLATLQAMRLYADALYCLGRRAESERAARVVLALSIRELGPENVLLADTHNQIAMALHRQGMMDEAREHYRKSIDHSERINGVKNFQTMTNLGIATNDKAEKVTLFRAALDEGRAQYGENHIRLAETMYWLAISLGPESDEAIELHHKVLQMRIESLGPMHPATVRSRAYLAWATATRLKGGGDLEESIEKFTEAIKLQPHGMHFYYADRGRVYADLSEWELAIADYTQAIEEWEASRPWIVDLRAAAFVQLEQWGNAAADLAVAVDNRPDDGIAWLRLGPVLLLAGDEAAYERYCYRMIDAYRNSPQSGFADIVCKCCLLRPGTVDINSLPIDAVDKSIKEATLAKNHLPWFWAGKALFEMRQEHLDRALEFVERAEADNRLDEKPVEALYLVVRALVEAKSDAPQQATQTLKKVQQIISDLEENEEYRRGQPILRDLLIAKILYEEATGLLEIDKSDASAEAADAS